MTDHQTGVLASGNHYRVTPHEISISAPDGELHRQTMTHDLISVGREGATVQARDIHGRSFDMETRSEDEARAVERVLLLTVPAEQPPPTRPRFELNQVNAGIAACLVLALVFGGYALVTDPNFWDIFGL